MASSQSVLTSCGDSVSGLCDSITVVFRPSRPLGTWRFDGRFVGRVAWDLHPWETDIDIYLSHPHYVQWSLRKHRPLGCGEGYLMNNSGNRDQPGT